MPFNRSATPFSDALVIVHAEASCMSKTSKQDKQDVGELSKAIRSRADEYAATGRPVLFTAYCASDVPEYLDGGRKRILFVGRDEKKAYNFLDAQVEDLRNRIASILSGKLPRTVEVGGGWEGACLSRTIRGLVGTTGPVTLASEREIRSKIEPLLPSELIAAVNGGKLRMYLNPSKPEREQTVVLKNHSIVF